MDRERMTDEEVQKFLNACEDFMHLGATLTGNVRRGFSDFKKVSDPLLKSNYVDKSAAELLTRSLNEFEKKMDSNLKALNKICTKGGKWFVFFLGKSLGVASSSLLSHEGSLILEEIQSTSLSKAEGDETQQVKKMGA
jgi:hypothetical protein